MKLGHYAKLPPRTMVAGQVVATVLASFATLGVANFQMNSIDGICDTDVQLKWICSGANTQFSALLQWGLIGPRRLFAPGALYAGLPYAFIGGLLWPVPWYLAKKRWPNSWVRTIHPMLLRKSSNHPNLDLSECPSDNSLQCSVVSCGRPLTSP
jgi:hypothetical protein